MLCVSPFYSANIDACKLRPGENTPTAILPVKFVRKGTNAAYNYDLLKLVLEKTNEKYGPCEARVSLTKLPNVRMHMHAVENQTVDLTGSTTSVKRDKRLYPIRIPLMKGLMGYRILFIRKGEQTRFEKIVSLSDLQSFKFGQGVNWPDNIILKANGLKVVNSMSHENLTKMLLAKRFDAYPRGVQQIALEKDQQYSVEQSILLAYVSPAYYHVAKDNMEFADRLRDGLETAISDGSFDELFNNQPLIQEAKEYLDLNKRRAFYLCNPNIHEGTPIDDPRYWHLPWPKGIYCDKD